jgi:toxin ParE1/3/4
MSKCIFAPLARQYLREINNYLAQFSPSAARKLKDKIKTQCKRLTNFPQMGRSCEKLYPGLRSFPVDDYIIFYTSNSGWSRNSANY